MIRPNLWHRKPEGGITVGKEDTKQSQLILGGVCDIDEARLPDDCPIYEPSLTET